MTTRVSMVGLMAFAFMLGVISVRAADPGSPGSMPDPSQYLSVEIQLSDLEKNDDAWALFVQIDEKSDGNFTIPPTHVLDNKPDVTAVAKVTKNFPRGSTVKFTMARIADHQQTRTDEYNIGFFKPGTSDTDPDHDDVHWVADPANPPLKASLPYTTTEDGKERPPDPKGLTWIYKVRAAEIDLKNIKEVEKISKGALVVKRVAGADAAPRKEGDIIIGTQQDILLNISSGPDKIKVYRSATGTTDEISINGVDNKFNASVSSKVHIYVEGVGASSTMRDAGLSLTYVGGSVPIDEVKLTSVWVDQPSVTFSSATAPPQISTTNEARTYYHDNKPQTPTFDLETKWTWSHDPDNHSDYPADPLKNAKQSWRIFGIPHEVKAKVNPTNFDYPLPPTKTLHKLHGNDLQLRGKVDGFRFVEEPTTKGSITATPAPGTPRTIELADRDPDTHRDVFLDNTPDPSGFIYLLDGPGQNIDPTAASNPGVYKELGWVFRIRQNFQVFAYVTIDGIGIRASPPIRYYIRVSVVQKDSPTGTNWDYDNRLTGDNMGAVTTGPEKKSWNFTDTDPAPPAPSP